MNKPIWRFFRRFILPRRKLGAILLFSTFLSTILNFPVPLLIRHIIDEIIPHAHLGDLAWVGAVLVILVALQGIFAYLEQYLAVIARESLLIDVQMELTRHVLNLPQGFFHAQQVGYLIARVRSDPEVAKEFFIALVDLANYALFLLIGLALLFYLDWRLALIAVSVLPLLALASMRLNTRMQLLCQEVQEGDALVSQELGEGFSAAQTVKLFGLAGWIKEKIIGVIEQLKRANVRTNTVGAIAGGVLTFITAVGPVLLIWMGAYRVIAGDLTLGTVIAFMALLAYLYGPAQAIITTNLGVQRAKVAASRIFEILDEQGEPVDGIPLAVSAGQVEIEQVSFAYPTGPVVLKNLSLTIEPGMRVAVVGHTGSGKSTLFSLLTRLYDPAAGTIGIDGQEIRHVSLASLRRQVLLITQDLFLFSGSIMENLRCGNQKVSDDEIRRIAIAVGAHEFIMELSAGYDTIIGERGAKLSGGQKQLIVLTRALLHRPQILLLDEATSALDSETETTVFIALAELMQGKTVIIAAHRLATVRSADLIVVFKEGELVEQGTHQELIASGGEYRAIFDEQLAT